MDKIIGKGHFAEVYKVISKFNNKPFAAKIMIKNEQILKEKKFIKQEVKILKFLSPHPNIVKLHEIFETEKKIILIFELLEGKNLCEFIKSNKKIEEKCIVSIFIQILKGLLYLNSKSIMHRDIKPENILFSENDINSTVKIADFSLAENFKDKKFSEFCGTPGYIAPEIFLKQSYNEKCDVYSLGVLLYMLFLGKSPFRGKDVHDILDKNRKNIIKIHKNDWKFSKTGKKLLLQMLEKDPIIRISLKDISADKWLTKSFVSKLNEPATNNNILYPEFLKSEKIMNSKSEQHEFGLIKKSGLKRSQTDIDFPKKNDIDNLSNQIQNNLILESQNSSNCICSKKSFVITKEQLLNLNSVKSYLICSKISISNDAASSHKMLSSSNVFTENHSHQKLSIFSSFNSNETSSYVINNSDLVSNLNNNKNIHEKLMKKYTYMMDDKLKDELKIYNSIPSTLPTIYNEENPLQEFMANLSSIQFKTKFF